MGYGQALLARDVYEEKGDLEAQASKKDLYSGIGRGLGTLVALGITGGTAAPSAAALGAGLSDLVFGGIGSKWAGDIEKGKFFKGERKKLRKRFDPLGEESLVGGLSAAVTAGIGQKVKMAKDVSAAQRVLPEGATAADFAKAKEGVESGYKGLDFAGSALGKTKAGQFLLGAKEFGLKGLGSGSGTVDAMGLESGLGIAGTSNAMGLEGLGGTNIGAGGVLSGVEGLGRLPEDYFEAGYDAPIPLKDNGVPLNRQDSYSPPLLGGDESLVPKRELPELEPDARGGGGLQIMEDQDEAWKKWQEELERQKKVWWRGRS